MIGLRQVGSKVLSKQLRLRPAQRRRFCQLYTAEFTHPGHGKSEKREQPKAAKRPLLYTAKVAMWPNLRRLREVDRPRRGPCIIAQARVDQPLRKDREQEAEGEAEGPPGGPPDHRAGRGGPQDRQNGHEIHQQPRLKGEGLKIK